MIGHPPGCPGCRSWIRMMVAVVLFGLALSAIIIITN